MVLYDVNGTVLSSSELTSQYPTPYYERIVSDGSAPGDWYYTDTGERVKKVTVKLTSAGSAYYNPTPTNNTITANSYPELVNAVQEYYKDADYTTKYKLGFYDAAPSKAVILEYAEKANINYNPPVNFGLNPTAVNTIVQSNFQVVRDDDGKIIGTLSIPSQTYEQRYEAATGSLPGQEPKPVFGAGTLITSGSNVMGLDTGSQSILLPKPITIVGTGYQDIYRQQSYSNPTIAKNTILNVSTAISNNAALTKTQSIAQGSPTFKTPGGAINVASPISNSALSKWTGGDLDKYLRIKSQQFEQRAQTLEYYDKSNIGIISKSGYNMLAFGAGGLSTLVGTIRHPLRTLGEIGSFNWNLITKPSETGYAIGEELKYNPQGFIGAQAGFLALGGAFQAGKMKLAKMTTYELDVPIAQYNRIKGRGNVVPEVGRANRLDINMPDTSPVQVNRGGTLKSYVELGGKKFLQKTISTDVGIIQVGDTAYVNMPRTKFQVQTYTSGGKVPLKISVGRQPINSLRSVSKVAERDIKYTRTGRDILLSTTPKATEVAVKGDVNKIISVRDKGVKDFNTRMVADETYKGALTEKSAKVKGGRVIESGTSIDVTQQILTQAKATPGVQLKKGYIDGELKATVRRVVPSRFVFDEKFKYPNDKVYMYDDGIMQIAGKEKAPRMKQISRADINAVGSISVIDRPLKGEKAPKLARKWDELLTRTDKSNMLARERSMKYNEKIRERLALETKGELEVAFESKAKAKKAPVLKEPPKLGKMLSPKRSIKTVLNPAASTDVGTLSIGKAKTATTPSQKINPALRISDITATRTNTDVSPISQTKTSTWVKTFSDTRAKVRTDVMPDVRTDYKVDTITDTIPAQITPGTPIGTPIKPPVLPPPGINIPPPTFEWEPKKGKQRQRRRSSDGLDWSGEYTASIEAGIFNIRGKRSKLGTISGLGIRPLR